MKSMEVLFHELRDAGYNVKQFDSGDQIGFTVRSEDFIVSVAFGASSESPNKWQRNPTWNVFHAEVAVFFTMKNPKFNFNDSRNNFVKLTKYGSAYWANSTSIMRYIRRYAPLR